MKEQFFGKTFWLSMIVLATTFGVSVLAYRFEISLPILLCFLLATAALSAKHPTLGIYAVFLELYSNSHGHLIYFDGLRITFSLRMAVFSGFFLGYIIYLIRTKTFPLLPLRQWIAFLPLCVALLLGFSLGLSSQNMSDVFKDGNAYLYFLFAIPILTVHWSSIQKKDLLQILAAGAVWNTIITLSILYIFTHFDADTLRHTYIFLRDIRLAEITNLSNGVYRVFIQSQFFTIVFSALLFAFLAIAEKKCRLRNFVLLFGVLLTVVILSLSRSFWIGITPSILLLLLFIIRIGLKTRDVWTLIGKGFLSILLAVLFIVVVVLFPFPRQTLSGTDLADAFRRRGQEDAAIASRWALLGPMQSTIASRAILGSGFGTSVSYNSQDPRAREQSEEGIWSTYAMEWGWLELWLKMGMMGPLGFLFLLFSLYKAFIFNQKTDQPWIGIGLFSGIIFLYTTHFFSPYLNHPIGIGFILFTLIFLPDSDFQLHPTAVEVIPHNRKEMRVPASALSLQAEQSVVRAHEVQS